MNPLEFNKKLQMARQFMALNNHAEALRLYARLVKQFPQGGGEYGSAAAVSGDFDLADRIWEKFRTLQPNTADLLTRLAAEYQSIGLHAKARVLYSKAADGEPRNLDVQLKLASILARTSSVEAARATVNRCLELDSRNEQARYLSAHLDRRENKLADAERKFRDLIASAPRDPRLRYSCHSEMANVLDRTERFEEAMAQLEEGKLLARQAFNLGAERKLFYERHEEEVRKAKSFPKTILDTWSKSFPLRARVPAGSVAFLSGSAREWHHPSGADPRRTPGSCSL